MNPLLFSILIVFLSTFSISAHATAQAGDRIVLDGKEEVLFTNPLSGFLERHPDSLPRSDVMSSSNWRGYVATWEVRGDALYLSKVEIEKLIPNSPATSLNTQPVNVLSTLFPGETSALADWYTGALIVPQGNRISYVHLGYGSTFEKYVVLRIDAGKVISRLNLSAKAFSKYRERKFREYQQTPEYHKSLAELMSGDEPWEKARAEAFLFSIEAETYLAR